MWKRYVVLIAVSTVILNSAYPVLAQAGSKWAALKKDPFELVLRVKDASVEELRDLSFMELNILKNAVFASKGYDFADDRPWLNVVYCSSQFYLRNYESNKTGETRRRLDEMNQLGIRTAAIGDADTYDRERWDLRAFAFPDCQDSGALAEIQKKAIANTHVALLKKIQTLGTIDQIDNALGQEKARFQRTEGGYAIAVILGKKIPLPVVDRFEISLRRDLHGYFRMLDIMKRIDKFDSMELLGLFAGDIMFLKSVIEAKYGKPHAGVLDWEISQMIGVVEKKADYDPNQLPTVIQERLRTLDDITKKIIRSDLNDIPESLKSRPIEFTDPDPYDFEGC